ncbi:hypothetical protein [Phaeodactylibacter xiamenensis]|uniref:hypothetical protein n=1 Tax=Phaeodactylibacter xiamenensis TaxID=1524460 RepID=UPI003BADA3C9
MKKLNSRLLVYPEFEMGPFFESVKRIKRQPITMATHKLGKNLRLKNQNEKPAAGSKSQAAPVSSFAACASIGEIGRKE